MHKFWFHTLGLPQNKEKSTLARKSILDANRMIQYKDFLSKNLCLVDLNFSSLNIVEHKCYLSAISNLSLDLAEGLIHPKK